MRTMTEPGIPTPNSGGQPGATVAVVDDLFDTVRATAYSFMLLALGVAVTIAEGADIAALSAAAPLVTKEFGLSSSALGGIFAFGVIGSIAASFLLSPLADRIGRKPAVLIGLSTALFGTLMATVAPNTFWFLASRLIGGLGIGLITSSIYALIAEVLPLRMRAMGTMITGCGFLLGGGVSSLLVSGIIDDYGYRAPFFVAAGLEILVITACLALLVESPFMMVRKGVPADRVARLLRRLGAKVGDEVTVFTTRDQRKATQNRVRALLVREHRAATLIFWLATFCTLGIGYMSANWLPALLVGAGADMATALRFYSMASFASAIVTIAVAWLTTKVNPAKVLITAYACLTLAAISISFLTGISYGFYTIMLAHFVIGGLSQFCLMGVVNRYYSSEIRATAVGYAMGAGRLGAIVGPLAGGALVSAGFSINGVYGLTAIPAGLAGLALIYLFLPGGRRVG